MTGFHGRGSPHPPHTLTVSQHMMSTNAMHRDDPAAPLLTQHHMPLRPFLNFAGTGDSANNMITGAVTGTGERMSRDISLVPISSERPHHVFWPFVDNNIGRSVIKAEQSTKITSCDFHMPKTETSNMLESILKNTLTSEYNIAKFYNNVLEEEENIVQREGDSGVRKKKRLTGEQLHALEGSFETDRKLEADRKQELAQRLGLEPRQIAVWFQNRRARSKTRHLEHDFATLKAQYHSVLAETLKLRAEVTRLTAELEAATSKGNEEEAIIRVKPTSEEYGDQHEQEGAIDVTLILNAPKRVIRANSPSTICCSTGSHDTNDHIHNHDHNEGDGGSSTSPSPISSICGCQVIPYNDEVRLPSNDFPSNTHNNEKLTLHSNLSSCGALPPYSTPHSPSYATINHLPPHDFMPSSHHDTSCRHTLHFHSSSCASDHPPYTQQFLTPYDTIEHLPSHFNGTFNGRSTTHLLNSSNTFSISTTPNNKFTPSLNLNHSNTSQLVPVLGDPHEAIASHQVPFSNEDFFFSQPQNHVGLERIWELTSMS